MKTLKIPFQMTFLLKKAHCNAEIYMFKNLISILLLKNTAILCLTYVLPNLCQLAIMILVIKIPFLGFSLIWHTIEM